MTSYWLHWFILLCFECFSTLNNALFTQLSMKLTFSITILLQILFISTECIQLENLHQSTVNLSELFIIKQFPNVTIESIQLNYSTILCNNNNNSNNVNMITWKSVLCLPQPNNNYTIMSQNTSNVGCNNIQNLNYSMTSRQHLVYHYHYIKHHKLDDQFEQRIKLFNQQMDCLQFVNISLNYYIIKQSNNYCNMLSLDKSTYLHVVTDENQQLFQRTNKNCNQQHWLHTFNSSYYQKQHYDTTTSMMLSSHFSKQQLKQLKSIHKNHFRLKRNYWKLIFDNNSNNISTYLMNLYGHSQSVRMDQKRIFVVDHPPLTISLPSTVYRSTASIHDIPHSLTIELLANNLDKKDIDSNDDNKNPILSFQYIEPHTVELLVVVTERMRRQFGPFINEYLLSTMTTVSSLLRHPSLKASFQLSIVDIILLDPIYARRHNLEDWLNSKQEQVMARFCKWVNRLRTPTYTWDSAILLNVGYLFITILYIPIGVAHYRSMCNPESSCLAVLDRGFGTGHIIAHELGHQLGAKHDFELNSDCGLEEQNHHVVDTSTWSNTYGLKLGTYPYYKADDEWDYKESHRNPDVHQYEFITRDTIMSGTLYFDQFPLRWSACSRQAIHSFIESNAANCLRHSNAAKTLHSVDKLTSHYVDNRPGRIFSLNQQCEFVLKNKGTQFCGQMLPVCRQLYCQDSEHRSCLPMEAAWAEGTPCGDNKWCIQGKCISVNENPTPLHGSWGDWGSWSQCSRSCGGGVQFSERECNNPEPQNGGDFCHGTRTRMRSCGTEPCEKQLNIRQMLCDKIDGYHKGQLKAYFPKLGEPTSCNLICLHNSHSVPHTISLPDGTPCYAQRDDICIQGKCWETGCDGILGSRLRFDHCRVCGGDNSTCEEIKGVFNGNTLTPPGTYPRGLITAVRIPRGVTNAFVRKVSDRNTAYSSDSYDDFMLLIFEELKTQIRRGETREPFAGAELYYSGSRSREEIVSITGRLNKDVNIVIRVENSHTTQSLPRVEYSYFIDKSQKNNSLYFIAENEARLAEERINRRTGRSQSTFKSLETSEKLINSVKSSPSELDNRRKWQNKPQVYFVWRISELPTGCTTCAGNVTTPAECYPLVPKDSERSQFSQFDLFRPVADYLCASMPRPPPVFRRCSDYCGVRWSAKPAPILKSSNNIQEFHTSSCSARCGEGREAVMYVCEEYIIPAEQKDKSKGIWRAAQLGEIVCYKAGLGSAPTEPSYVTCKGACHPVYWVLSNWTECSNLCGDGKRKRILYCQDEIGQNWPLNECIQYAEFNNQQLNNSQQFITYKLVQEILLNYQQNNYHHHHHISIEHNFYIEQYNDCFSISLCHNNINWLISEWSECEPLNEQMKFYCRQYDNLFKQNNTFNNNNIIGIHYRNVTCILNNNNNNNNNNMSNYYNELNKYIEISSNHMNNNIQLNVNFCRKASIIGELIEEPNNHELCYQPNCYRWGNAQITKCSVSCGTGVKQIKIPCERITLKDELNNSSSNEKRITLNGIQIVENDKCMQNLQYIPRLFTDKLNSTIYVETIERRIDNVKDIIPLKVDNINQPILLPCNEASCDLRVPAWRTTSWST
ncbi:hypothetical protein MN116_005411, partial [Schistosoma mekongi]